MIVVRSYAHPVETAMRLEKNYCIVERMTVYNGGVAIITRCRREIAWGVVEEWDKYGIPFLHSEHGCKDCLAE